MARWVSVIVALALGAAASPAAETLEALLTRYGVPVSSFSRDERQRVAASFAIANQERLFLMAYYDDDGSGFIQRPLRLIRHDFTSGVTRRAELGEVNTLFMGETPSVCVGSVMKILEQDEHVYVEIHKNPSNFCTLVLTDSLALEHAISGWLLAVMGGEHAIVGESVVHFAPYHPLRISVYDVRRKTLARVYPAANDEFRRAFAGAIRPHMNDTWCRAHNAPCDPDEFDGFLVGDVSVNQRAHVFGFVARMQWRVYGETFDDKVPPRDVAYVYRARNGAWEYRAFDAGELGKRFGLKSIEDVVKQKPDAAFGEPGGSER